MITPCKVIETPWPDSSLSQNFRGHWSKTSKATRVARAMAKALCLESPRIERIPDAVIFVEYWPNEFRMDVQNVHAMVKPHIDGIADAMGCDDKLFEVDFPRVFAGRSDPGKVVFRVMYPLAMGACGRAVS